MHKNARSKRARSLSSPGMVSAREHTKAKNLKLNAALQVSKEYKEDRNLGQRVKVVYVEKIVYVQSKALPSLSKDSEEINVNMYMIEEEQEWLRDLVRREGATKDGTLFTQDFISKFAKRFGREVSDYMMRRCLSGLGFSFERLRSSYHKVASEDAKNLKRRDRIVPLLHYLHNYKRNVCVWSFDESSFHVGDFSKFAWIDPSMKDANLRKHIPAADQKGERVNVSAFASEKFGVLYDDSLRHHVGALNREKNDANATLEMFRWFARIARQKYPDFLHVVCTDSPSIHAGLPPDACDPSRINLSDKGVNRGKDLLYGENGLVKIFSTDRQLAKLDTREFTLKDFRKALWKHKPVKAQLFLLEKVLQEQGHLLLFHPVAHPQLAPIELLWRDMKYDYRVNWPHTRANLIKCVTSWFERSDDEFISICERNFKTSQMYIVYYLSGGVEKITERKIKAMAANHFDQMVDGQTIRRERMQKYLYKMVKVPTFPGEKDKLPNEKLFEVLKKWTHELNWLRRKHGEIESE